MGNGGYLTIEETARKLGMSTSWVKGQICEGKLGATLSGRQWLIPARELGKLPRNNTPSRVSEEPVHNFLDHPATEGRGAPEERKASSQTRGRKPARLTKRSLLPAENRRPGKGEGARSSLVHKIKKLDREFERQTVRLRSAMVDYRAAAGTGKRVKPPGALIQRWRAAKAELKYLVANAEAKGLALPAGLTIRRILAQEAAAAKRKTAPQDSTAPKKTAPMPGGIEGYSAGSDRWRQRETKRLPADVEARLIVLRSRERNAAHSMRDRAKDQAARDAAGIRWAEARQEAEKLEREFGAVRPQG